MNKKDLARAIADKTGFPVVDTRTTLNAFFDVVKDTLVKKEKIQLVGFGTFEVRKRIERIGKSPQDPSKEIVIPAKNVPYFKPGSEMKEGVNSKKEKASKKVGKNTPKKAPKGALEVASKSSTPKPAAKAPVKTKKAVTAVQGVVAKTEKKSKPVPQKTVKAAVKAAPVKKGKK